MQGRRSTTRKVRVLDGWRRQWVDAAGVTSNVERIVRSAAAREIELDVRMNELAGGIHITLDLKRPVGR